MTIGSSINNNQNNFDLFGANHGTTENVSNKAGANETGLKRTRVEFENEELIGLEEYKALSEQRIKTIGTLNKKIKILMNEIDQLKSIKLHPKMRGKNNYSNESLEENENLKNEIEKIKKEYTRVCGDYEISKVQIKDLEEVIYNKEKDVLDVYAEFEIYSKESEQFRQELLNDYSKITSENEVLKNQIKTIEEECIRIFGEYEKSCKQNQELSNLSYEYQVLRGSMEEKQVLQKTLSDELSIKNRLNQYLNNQIIDLTANRDCSAKIIINMNSEFYALKNQYNVQSDLCRHQENRLAQQINQIEKLREDFLRKTKECSDLKEKLSNNQKTIANNKNTKQIARFKNKIKEFKFELKEKILDFEESKKINDNLEQHNSDLLKRNNVLEAFEFAKNKKISRYEKEFKKFELEIKELKKSENDKKLEISKLKTDYHNLQDVNKGLFEKNTDLENTNLEKTCKIKEFENETNQIPIIIENFQSHLYTKDAELSELQQINSDLISDSNQFREVLYNKNQEASQLTEVNKRMTDQIKTQQEQIEFLKSELEAQKENNSRFAGKSVHKFSIGGNNHSRIL